MRCLLHRSKVFEVLHRPLQIRNPLIKKKTLYSQGDNNKQKKWNSINVFEMLSHQHLPVPWVWHPMGREGLEPATR
ncbi:hypothetical protein EGW74_16125 [Enterococcus casseliflavus]|nr:hypothetical protein EGW74_16125 [Enterococcus casseliflavus]